MNWKMMSGVMAAGMMFAMPASAQTRVGMFEKAVELSGPVCAGGYHGVIRVEVFSDGSVLMNLDGGNMCLSDTIQAVAEVVLVDPQGVPLITASVRTDVPGRGFPWNGEVRRGVSRVEHLAPGSQIGKVQLGARNAGANSIALDIFNTALTIGSVVLQ